MSQSQPNLLRLLRQWALAAPLALALSACNAKPTPVAPSTPAPLQVIDTIMVPGADDKLHARKVSRLALDTQLKSGGNPAPALGEIIKLAPQWFPKGTRVEDVKENSGVVTVLLSPEFGDAKHWQRGESMTELAVYSLVNTLAKGDKKVALTLEGKPIPSLGELATGEALTADPTLNAKSKTDAAKTDDSANAAAPNASGTASP